MNTYTNARICYGVEFDNEYKFPWDIHPYNGSFVKWCNEIPHQIPVILLGYGVGTFDSYGKNINRILAVDHSVTTAIDGNSTEIILSRMKMIEDDCRKVFVDFCKSHKIKMPRKPSWLLSAYISN